MTGCYLYPEKERENMPQEESPGRYVIAWHMDVLRRREEDGGGEGAESIRSKAFRGWLSLWLSGARQKERCDRKWDERTFICTWHQESQMKEPKFLWVHWPHLPTNEMSLWRDLGTNICRLSWVILTYFPHYEDYYMGRGAKTEKMKCLKSMMWQQDEKRWLRKKVNSGILHSNSLALGDSYVI